MARLRTTKAIAKRIDLGYLSRRHGFRLWRRRLTWLAPLAAAAGIVPFLVGVGGGEKAFSNGPVSRAHAVFESNCAVCHAQTFSHVANAACQKCHDGPLHQANAVGEERCAECHLEHRGAFLLAEVAGRHCTRCHADLSAHGKNVRLAATNISGFRPGRHPEFSSAAKPDRRPLRLNHAAHMPPQPKTIRGKKLPMDCSQCHATDLASPTGDLFPVTFEQHCRSCHERELEYDVYQLLGASARPAPHTKDPKTIHDFLSESYQKLVADDPSVVQRPLGRDLQPAPNAAAWLAAVVTQSETFLFERKCKYCHEYEDVRGDYPVVKKTNRIRGQYLENAPVGGPWMVHARFSHRAHRAVDCSSCHRAASASSQTGDVLVPKMENCLACHGSTGTAQDLCAQCHLYHDKSKERDKDRRPIEQLVRGAF